MLSYMKGDEAVGWYNAAYRLIVVLLFIPSAYMSSIFPIMSRFYISSKSLLGFIYQRSLKYMLIISVPISAGTTILASRIILLIFGAEYYNSIIALQILIWAIVFIFANLVFVNLFQSINRQIVVTIIDAAAALLNILLNLLLIPRYGIVGASIATVVVTAIAFVVICAWSSRIEYGIPIKSLAKIAVQISAATAVMSLFVIYLKDFYILAVIPLAALLYFAVVIIIKAIDKEDLSLLRSIFAKPPQGAVSDDNNGKV
jgi:O-antigen/teichoic acid export membrane protein